MIEFFLPMIPPTATQQEHKIVVRDGRPHFYEPTNVRAARQKLMGLLAQHAPNDPAEGAVRLITKWIWPLPAKDRDKHTASSNMEYAEYKITRPDTDNMIKMLKDCMTRTGYWQDDAQVASEVTEKFRGMQPGIYVRVEDITV